MIDENIRSLASLVVAPEQVTGTREIPRVVRALPRPNTLGCTRNEVSRSLTHFYFIWTVLVLYMYSTLGY